MKFRKLLDSFVHLKTIIIFREKRKCAKLVELFRGPENDQCPIDYKWQHWRYKDERDKFVDVNDVILQFKCVNTISISPSTMSRSTSNTITAGVMGGVIYVYFIIILAY